MSDWTRREVLASGIAAAATGSLARGHGEARTRFDPPQLGRDRLLLDSGWRFHLGHADDPARDFDFGRDDVFGKVGRLFAPSRANFDAAAWRAIDLPHDWAVELPFENAPQLTAHGSRPLGREWPATSIGWYRRTFDLPARDNGRRISLEFDGVFRDCIVALNGHFLGRNLSGYAPFRFDVTDVASYEGRNVLVVRVDATEREGWFYEGAGIYRHVWLVKTHPAHVAQWGTAVTSDVAAGAPAILTLTTQVVNESDDVRTIQVVSTIQGPDGRIAATARSAALAIQPWSGREIPGHANIRAPMLWSVDTPHLYRMITTLVSDGVEIDRYETPFGIRSIRFDADRGFLLNGERVELKGTCNHQDHAGVGSALPDRLHAYRVEKLKSMGSNAWRTAHNPPAPELLDACDRLGMLVLDETRLFSSQDEGLGQLGRLIRRDRNHPSVIAWSIANEEWAVQGSDRGTRIAQSLRRHAHRLDTSRPVTAGMDSAYTPGKGITLGVDVQGFNYQREDLDAFRRTFPTRPAMGTETASAYATRGIYAADAARGYVSAYDVNKPGYGATAEEWWTFYAARPWLAGGFAWTGFDYRGEPSPYQWPCISSHFGILDTCGFPKDTFFYYQAWWGGAPVLHLFPHWSWPGREGQELEVWCHSNLERVELLLNGGSLGTRDVPRNGHVAWRVPYAPGKLEARGTSGGRIVLTAARETTTAPARIVLQPDRSAIGADGEDVSVIEARIADAAGRVVPAADDVVTFAVSGSGRLIGVGNGDPSSHEADKGDTRRAFNGCCMAIVQATREAGSIRIEASAPNLESGVAIVTCEAGTPRPFVPPGS